MKDKIAKIAMGFHTCVDYELIWDTEAVEQVIREFDIHAEELRTDMEVHSERSAWVFCLSHLKAGIGGEIVPDDEQSVINFANRFDYKVTLGGTATRAAIVLDRLGYGTILQTSCWNEHVKRLLPERVRAIPGAEDNGRVSPHAVLQCRKGVRIHAGDIDFITPRENRMMISRDVTSLDIPVLPDTFGPELAHTEAFLLGCFSEILDEKIMDRCLENTKQLLAYLPEGATVVYEDGCYIRKDFRRLAHKKLKDCIDIISMNEDELQEFIGRKIDILDADAVSQAVKQVYDELGIPELVVHTAKYALCYGEEPERIRESLKGGTYMAATRFRIGDDFTEQDYEETAHMADREDSTVFCREICGILGDRICVVPSKEMSHVEHPTVVGLGDSFAGGFLPGLLK